MSNIQRLPAKQPEEAWYIKFDFSSALNSSSNPDAGENLATPIQEVVITDEETGEDVSETMADAFKNRVSGQVAYVWVEAGEDDHIYHITCRVETETSDRVLELDARLPVREM